MFRVFIAQRLKPRHTAHGFARAGLDVVDVVVVENTQIRSGVVCAAARMGDALWVDVSACLAWVFGDAGL
jgi:hypothetical protein